MHAASYYIGIDENARANDAAHYDHGGVEKPKLPRWLYGDHANIPRLVQIVTNRDERARQRIAEILGSFGRGLKVKRLSAELHFKVLAADSDKRFHVPQRSP